jgi:hypothetical protein
VQKSDSITNLAKSLAAFQAEVENPANTAINPHFRSKYAPLNEILNTVRPTLAKHGLSVLQSPSGEGDQIIITTLLMHASGEWVEADPLVLKADRPTAQGAGSAITYGRRYSLSAVLGISSEDDDDGNGAEGKPKKTQDKPTTTQSPQQQTQQQQPQQGAPADAISEPQRKKIYAMSNKLKLVDHMKQLMFERYSVTDSKALTKKQATDLIDFMTKMENGEACWKPSGDPHFTEDEIPFD